MNRFVIFLFLVKISIGVNNSGYASVINYDSLIYPDGILLEKIKNREVNNLRLITISYFLNKNENITYKKILNFYKKKLLKEGFKNTKNKRYTLKNFLLYKHSFASKDKNEFMNIIIEKKIKYKKYYIYVSILKRISYLKDDIFNIYKDKDNPGFDIKDIPRLKEFKRIFAIRTETDNNIPIDKLLYKTSYPIKWLVSFYLKKMKQYGWLYKRTIFKNNEYILFYSKGNRQCEIYFTYNSDLQKNVINILVIHNR